MCSQCTLHIPLLQVDILGIDTAVIQLIIDTQTGNPHTTVVVVISDRWDVSIGHAWYGLLVADRYLHHSGASVTDVGENLNAPVFSQAECIDL